MALTSQIDISLAVKKRIIYAVRSLYETYPYPNYPLLAKPRWQEGWLTSGAFNSALAGSITGETVKSLQKNILIAGCGEILPAVICANEPYSNKILAVDLSQRSIQRAKFRCASELFRLKFRQSDLIELLAQEKNTFDHIDCYGVLHHLANPVSSLDILAQAMTAGATARIMVYNSAARSWIHQWQLVFRNLKLSMLPADVTKSANILFSASQLSPKLAGLLEQMGPSIFTNRTRFVDTFLHPREARVSAEQWFTGLKKVGLRLIGLFDRYEECDELPNPLWGISEETIEQHILAGRFSNNLEILLQKPGGAKFSFPKQKTKRFASFSSPPRAWSNTSDTAMISKSMMRHIWRSHHKYLAGKNGELTSKFLGALSDISLQRLTRTGAVLPQQLGHEAMLMAKKPIYRPKVLDKKEWQKSTAKDVSLFIEKLCLEHAVPERYQDAISARLKLAIQAD